jgi:hypothetical protein
MSLPLFDYENGPVDASVWTELYREFDRKVSRALAGKSFFVATRPSGQVPFPVAPRVIMMRGTQYPLVATAIPFSDVGANPFFVVGTWETYEHQIYTDTAAGLNEVSKDVPAGVVIVGDVGPYQYTTLLTSLQVHTRGGLAMRGEFSSVKQKQLWRQPLDVILDGADSFTWPTAYDKHYCIRFHNLQGRPATVDVHGRLEIELGPWECRAVRRSFTTDSYRAPMRYFWPYDPGDLRLRKGSVNNIDNPLILLECAQSLGLYIDPFTQGDLAFPIRSRYSGTSTGSLFFHSGDVTSIRWGTIDDTAPEQPAVRERAFIGSFDEIESWLGQFSMSISTGTGNTTVITGDTSYAAHDMVTIGSNLFVGEPSSSSYVSASRTLPAVTAYETFPASSASVDAAHIDSRAETLTAMLGLWPSLSPTFTTQTLRQTYAGPLVAARGTINALSLQPIALQMPPAAPYFDLRSGSQADGPFFTLLQNDANNRAWPGIYDQAIGVGSTWLSPLQPRSTRPLVSDDIVEQPGELDDTIGSMPTRDFPVFVGGSTPTADNAEAVGTGTSVTTQNRAAALAGTGQFATDRTIRLQFNDYNRLAWIVNALKRSPVLVSLRHIPFRVTYSPAPNQWATEITTLPFLSSVGNYHGLSFHDIRSELTNARESDGATLVLPNLPLDAKQQALVDQLGIPERRSTFVDLIPARGGQQLTLFYYSIRDILRVADANGVPFVARMNIGDPVKTEYTAFASFDPTVFDTLTPTGATINRSTESQVGLGFADPTLRRCAMVSTGRIERNGAIVSAGTGFLCNDDYSTGNVDAIEQSVLREWDYMALQ